MQGSPCKSTHFGGSIIGSWKIYNVAIESQGAIQDDFLFWAWWWHSKWYWKGVRFVGVDVTVFFFYLNSIIFCLFLLLYKSCSGRVREEEKSIYQNSQILNWSSSSLPATHCPSPTINFQSLSLLLLSYIWPVGLLIYAYTCLQFSVLWSILQNTALWMLFMYWYLPHLVDEGINSLRAGFMYTIKQATEVSYIK